MELGTDDVLVPDMATDLPVDMELLDDPVEAVGMDDMSSMDADFDMAVESGEIGDDGASRAGMDDTDDDIFTLDDGGDDDGADGAADDVADDVDAGGGGFDGGSEGFRSGSDDAGAGAGSRAPSAGPAAPPATAPATVFDDDEPEETTEFDSGDSDEFEAEIETATTGADVTRASVGDFSSSRDTLFVGGKDDEQRVGTDGSDDIRGKKGDDDLDGASGDDFIRGGHGDDTLDGGAGSDIVNGGKGDDDLSYTLSENIGSIDFYDGGKGSDALVLNLTTEEYEALKDELDELSDWIAENADPKASEGVGFNDASASSSKHPVFETSFGLNIRNVESLEINITDEPVVDDPVPDEPVPDEPVVDDPVADEPVPDDPTPDEPVITKVNIEDGEEEQVSVTLTPGAQITVSVDVDIRELPPIYDVVMLQDLSGSFWNDIENVRDQFSNLYDSLTADGDVAFGVASFVDKPITPFGWPGTDYVYKTDHAVTTDKAAIQTTLDNLDIYYGYDTPEAQLEALVQIALRVEEIGFRDGAERFVVLSTDAPFHKAGDYTGDGVVANDLDTEFENEDYPTMAAVGELLKSAGITPIFAVTNVSTSADGSDTLQTYQDLVDSWGFGVVTDLGVESNQLVSAITNGLKEATTDVTLSVSSDDYGYISSMTPSVYEDAGPGTYTFDLTLEIPEDTTDFGSDSLTLEIAGYGEINLDIEIVRVDITGDDSADTLSGDAGPNGLFGMAGDDVLIGNGGEDTIDGGAGDDVLTGGEGDDTFVFADGDGNDVLTDFAAGDGGGDIIDLRKVTTVNSFSEVISAATEVGDDTVITLSDTDSLTLEGVSIAELDENDFAI